VTIKSIYSPPHVRVVIGDWKSEYNHDNRHSSLGYLAPAIVLGNAPTPEKPTSYTATRPNHGVRRGQFSVSRNQARQRVCATAALVPRAECALHLRGPPAGRWFGRVWCVVEGDSPVVVQLTPDFERVGQL
jgi:hypothetical protein